MKFVSVIGGSGFIGTCLCRQLSKVEKLDFTIIDKSISNAFPEKTKIADVRSLDSLQKSVIEGSVLINLAAEHRDDVKPLTLYDEVNIWGAINICKIAREKDIKTIIFTSSVAVYGFAPIGTDEAGAISPFNDYGRTKYEAELVFKEWQQENPGERTLVIVRPAVVFGERNRGNVYNLLKQIASGRFVMIGKGENIKSMAYVENVASFLNFSINFKSGIHIYNYVDKPDFNMNQLVSSVRKMLGKSSSVGIRIPYKVGYLIGKGFDIAARVAGKRLPISSIRVQKFCANSMFNTSLTQSGFFAKVSLTEALERTVRYEFVEKNENQSVFYSE